MDCRDVPIWRIEAQKKHAKDQKRASNSAEYPNMTEESRKQYMDALNEQIDGPAPETPKISTADQEAEWARNREALRARIGSRI